MKADASEIVRELVAAWMQRAKRSARPEGVAAMAATIRPAAQGEGLMDETTIAALEGAVRSQEHGLERLEEQYPTGREPNEEVKQAKRDLRSVLERKTAELGFARAQLAQEQRERADAATAKVVAANLEMAAASRDAARASAVSARASSGSALWTLLAAAVAALGVLL
jgi:hypothetical protein